MSDLSGVHVVQPRRPKGDNRGDSWGNNRDVTRRHNGSVATQGTQMGRRAKAPCIHTHTETITQHGTAKGCPTQGTYERHTCGSHGGTTIFGGLHATQGAHGAQEPSKRATVERIPLGRNPKRERERERERENRHIESERPHHRMGQSQTATTPFVRFDICLTCFNTGWANDQAHMLRQPSPQGSR